MSCHRNIVCSLSSRGLEAFFAICSLWLSTVTCCHHHVGLIFTLALIYVTKAWRRPQTYVRRCRKAYIHGIRLKRRNVLFSRYLLSNVINVVHILLSQVIRRCTKIRRTWPLYWLLQYKSTNLWRRKNVFHGPSRTRRDVAVFTERCLHYIPLKLLVFSSDILTLVRFSPYQFSSPLLLKQMNVAFKFVRTSP